uniref:Beta-defensin n=1 Tax=Rhinolophus ferrumequinum TaxID=59479 RepID=A0A671F7C2_RHIFE
MNLLMLTFIICGLLTLVTKAGWEAQRCWKNNVGHCRIRCLHVERYKILCMNKLNCCTPIKFDEYSQRPLPPLFPTINFNTWDVFHNSPITGISDEVTINKAEESTETGTTTPTMKISTQALTTTPKMKISTQALTTTPKMKISTQALTTTPKMKISTQALTTTPKMKISTQALTTTPKMKISTQALTTTSKMKMSK